VEVDDEKKQPVLVASDLDKEIRVEANISKYTTGGYCP